MAMVGTMFIQVTRITTASNETQNSNGLASNVANEVVGRPARRDHAGQEQRRDARPGDRLRNPQFTDDLLAVEHERHESGPRARSRSPSTRQGRSPRSRCTAVASGSYWTFSDLRQHIVAQSSARAFSLPPERVGPAVHLPRRERRAVHHRYRQPDGGPTRARGLHHGDRARPSGGREQRPGASISNTVVLRNLGLDSGS